MQKNCSFQKKHKRNKTLHKSLVDSPIWTRIIYGSPLDSQWRCFYEARSWISWFNDSKGNNWTFIWDWINMDYYTCIDLNNSGGKSTLVVQVCLDSLLNFRGVYSNRHCAFFPTSDGSCSNCFHPIHHCNFAHLASNPGKRSR